jgi:hypothetical protein
MRRGSVTIGDGSELHEKITDLLTTIAHMAFEVAKEGEVNGKPHAGDMLLNLNAITVQAIRHITERTIEMQTYVLSGSTMDDLAKAYEAQKRVSKN